MKRYIAGTNVEKGSYYDPINGRLVEFSAAGKLPGPPDELYYKVNGWMMLIMAPIATLLFVILLPVAYIASFATLWGYKLMLLLLGLGHGPIPRHR